MKNTKNNSYTAGHRERVKKRFREEGLDHFDDFHVLELLLFYCIPRVDTKIIAKDLINRFGSLSQVLEAKREDLMKVEGIGENAATFLNLVMSVGRYYHVDRVSSQRILDTTEKCGEYLLPKFLGRRNELVYLLCMDARCKVLCCRQICEGSVNSAALSIRRIVETALGVNASSVVLAHNHPSGLALPSGNDIVVTHRVAKALEAVEITLADHIIVGDDDDFVSLLQSGHYHPNEYK